MADAPKKPSELAPAAPPDVQLAALVAAEVIKVLAPPTGRPGKPAPRPLAEEHKGSREYIVGPGKAFQGNRLFQPGERITIVDQRPARDWTPVTKSTPAEKPAASPVSRVNDKPVG